jgi:[protein-PII] uridylyltransferase
LGERAEDTFLVTGDALKKSRTLLHLETELVEALQTSSEAVSDSG